MYQCKVDINAICELLAVKHGDLQLDLFSNSVLDVFVQFLCTTYFFTIFLYFLLHICVYYVPFS